MTVRTYIRPRRLDKRVRIETRVTTKGASGGMVATWTTLATVWAGIKDVTTKRSNNERDSTSVAGGEVAVGDTEIEIRYRSGLVAENTRIVYGSTTYDVVHINDLFAQGSKMILLCQTGVSDG